MTALWLDTAPPGRPYPEADAPADADVIVIGAGITGITTALRLQEAGARTILLEAGRIACGVSGQTTAKVTTQHGLVYADLADAHGAEAARRYAVANERALDWIAARVEGRGIDCGWRRRDAYAYVSEPEARERLEAEAQAACAAGLRATVIDDPPLPYAVAGALRFDDQAELDPRRYLLALADQLVAAGGTIHEHSRAVEVSEDDRLTVKTPGARLTAGHVVVATHVPFPDRSLAFARITPMRSYLIACRIAGAPPAGMHISADGPTRSLRGVPVEDGELLLVGGEGHRTGDDAATPERFDRLEAFARAHWDVQAVTHRWSSQDAMPLDGLPLVGRATPRSERLLLATGFAKWGMTNGTAAAELLADLVQGRANASAASLQPVPVSPRALPAAVREGAGNAWRLVADPRRGADRGVDDLAPGDGAIVERRWRARRGPPAGGRQPRRGVAALHAPRLRGALERRRVELGLPMPRLALQPRGRGAPRTGGPPARVAVRADQRTRLAAGGQRVKREVVDQTTTTHDGAGSIVTKAQLADVSTALVQLYRRFYGRGPTRAKTICDGNVLTTVLADIFTTVEQTLVDRGRGELVTGVRTAFQAAMRHEFIATVEVHTGRTVESFTSGVDIGHGVATETFILVPLPDEPSDEVVVRRADPALRAQLREADGARSDGNGK